MEGLLSTTELQVFQEKSRAFLCTVRIPLDKLRCENLSEDPNITRQEDEKNIARLAKIFAKDCDRWDPDNHVPVLIPRSAIPDETLARLRVRTRDDYPLFNPDNLLPFLSGRHRIEAARRALDGPDRWWIAELYSDDLSLLVKKHLREHDPNCAKWYDGDILRQIRISTIQGDTVRREKFLARLSDSKQDCVKRLELLPVEFWDSLDDLIPFAGLWPAIMIGTFPRLLNLHCPEEMTRYLRRVKATMISFIGENENYWPLIDANTAHLIQGRCPGLSYEDREYIHSRMRAKELFPAIQDANIRSRILESLCSINHVITTIHTFLEDTKYLEPCVIILKKILPGKSKGSLSQYFKGLHNGQHNAKVQTTDYSSEDRTTSGSHASWVAYRVLWLLTLRHFPEMGERKPRKDIGKRSTRKPGLEPQWWISLSALALANGYRRVRKQYRDHKAADSSEIDDCVRRLRPSMGPEVRRRRVQLMCQIMGDPECPDDGVTATPELTSDHDNYRPELSDRCGVPRTSALLADKSFLFFDPIYSTSYDMTPKRYLTSFAITRDFFHSFFGTAEDDLDQPTVFRLPRNASSLAFSTSAMVVDDAEDEETMQGVDEAGPPVNQRSAPPPPHEVPLPMSPTRPVESSHNAVTMSGTRSPDRYRRFTRRGRSASPTTHRYRERSNSTDRQRRRNLTRPRSGDAIFPRATQQLPPKGPSAESTKVAVSLKDMSAGEIIAPHSAGPPIENARTGITSRSHNITQRGTIFPGATQQLLLGPPVAVESTQAIADVSTEDVEVAPAFPAAQPSAEDMEIAPPSKARTDAATRSRSLDGRRKITDRGRSASPTTHSHRSGRRRARSNSHDRRDLISTRARDTIFPGATRQLLLAGPPVEVESTHATADLSIKSMEIVPLGPPPRTIAEPIIDRSYSATIESALPAAQPSAEDMEMVPWAPAAHLVGKARTAIAPRSRSLDGRRKITQRDRSASPTHRRRERSASPRRERRRGRGSGSSRIEDEDMEMVQWVPLAQTVAEPLVEYSHSATTQLVPAPPAAQPSVSPVFSQDIRDRNFSALPDIQLSMASRVIFSQEAQSGTPSTLAATQPAAAFMPVLRQEIQDITISLQDASRLLFLNRKRTVTKSFIVLSLTGRDRFHVRKADPTNAESMVNTLQIPSVETYTFASDHGKRLKLIAPVTIMDKARDQELDTALVVPKEKAGEITRQLENSKENSEELGEELYHKEPQPSLTVDEMVKRNGNPVRISIWERGEWKNLQGKFTYGQTMVKVRELMRNKGVRPYDINEKQLTLESCFLDAQKDNPPTIYLCLPEQAGSAFQL